MAQEKGILPKTGSYLPASVLARILDKAMGSKFFVFDDFKDNYEMIGYVVKAGCHMVDGRISYNNEETNVRDKVVGIGHYGVFVRTDMSSDFTEVLVKYSPNSKETVMAPEKNDDLKEYGSLIPNAQAPDNKIKDTLIYYFFYDGANRQNTEDLRVFEIENNSKIVTVRPSAAPYVSPGKTFDMRLTLEEARGKTFMGSMFNNTSILNETLVGVCLPEIGNTIRLKGAYSSGTNGQAYCLIELEYVAGTTWKIAAATVTYSFNTNAGLVGSLAGLFYKG